MTDSTDGQSDARVYNFPRLGFRLPPAATPTAPPAPGFPPSAPAPDDGRPARRARRSPLAALAALPDPGAHTPVVPPPAARPQPGHVPATFRSDGGSGGSAVPRLGALSLAACLAVAVAALRGTHAFLQDRRQRRLAREAENAQLREARMKMRLATEEARGKHVLAMQGLRDKATQQRAKRVQSGPEFGGKTLGRGGSGGSSGRGGGAGRGSGSGGTGKKPPGGGPSGRGGGSSSRTNGLGPGRKNTGPGAGPKPKKPDTTVGPKPKKSPLHGSQAGSKTSLDKQRRKQLDGGSGGGSDRTGLGAALKKDTQKAAARRWRKRQKNGGATPALWGSNQKNQKHAPKNPTGGPGQPAKVNLKKTPGQPGNGTPGAAAGKSNTQAAGRTTLAQALRKAAHRAARKRLKRRRQTVTPPIWSAPKNGKPKNGNGGRPKVNLNKPKKPRTTPGATGSGSRRKSKRFRNAGRKAGAWWANARARTRKNGGCFGGTTGPTGTNTGTGSAGAPGGSAGRTRRSPFQNAGQAAGQAAATITVERDDYPGAQAKRWEPDALGTGTPALPKNGPAALDTAPTVNPPRPGTTRPKEPIAMPPAKPDRRIAKARNQAARTGHGIITAARHMDAQHATEINLDDALDEYGDFKDDGFKTHDQAAKLADRGRKLRDILALFAEDLAVNHNLIGPLFSGAMARMAESMDLVARMSDEMQVSSLEAAEQSETADNDLNDTYRPITQATADAGLTTPSAPIHNQT
jgi:hypothetical protein